MGIQSAQKKNPHTCNSTGNGIFLIPKLEKYGVLMECNPNSK